MTQKISDTKPVIDFIDMATRYCQLIEDRENKSEIQLLQEVIIILPQLCVYAMKLPDIKQLSDYEPSRIPHEQWEDIYKSLQHKLGEHDYYQEIFDPYQNKEEQVTASLADDLADIYGDIKRGLQDWVKASPSDRLHIIWYWKLDFDHWGAHATGAFRALYSLLYHHIEDKYGDYIGIRDEN